MGGTWGEANPQPQGMQPCKRGGENQAKSATLIPITTRLKGRKREKLHAQILRAPHSICSPFSPENLSPSPGFKIQQEAQQESTQIEAKIRGGPPPFQAPELQCRRPLW